MAEMEDYAGKIADRFHVELEWFVANPPTGHAVPDCHAAAAVKKVIMEAMHNLVKHSEARHARVAFHFSDRWLELKITDDGKGYTGPRKGGHGIGNMQSRMEELGGTFEIYGVQGTTILIHLPLHGAEIDRYSHPALS